MEPTATKRSKHVLTGIIVSVASSATCFSVAVSATLGSELIPHALVAQLPSSLVVGTVVGLVASHLRASMRLTVIGAASGWVIGSLITMYFFIALGLRIDHLLTLIVFFLAQVAFGIVAGVMPAAITRALRGAT